MKLVLLNGPPRTGKDTAAKALLADFNCRHEKFSAPLKLAFAAMIGAKIDDAYVVEYYEEHKDELIPMLGVSYRQWQIDFSEKMMKPLYGNDIFGRLLHTRIRNRGWHDDLIVISDCGFQIEVDVLLKLVNASDALIIKLNRDDYTYANDSREYVTGRGVFEEQELDNRDMEQFQSDVYLTVKLWRERHA